MALMPWKETTSMNEKERFVMLAQTGRFTITGFKKGQDSKRVSPIYHVLS
jgi:hypothetical protein